MPFTSEVDAEEQSSPQFAELLSLRQRNHRRALTGSPGRSNALITMRHSRQRPSADGETSCPAQGCNPISAFLFPIAVSTLESPRPVAAFDSLPHPL